MTNFLVIARDGKDTDAPARRKKARPSHLEGLKPMVEKGELITAGGLINADGEMIGSTLIMQYPSRADLDVWLAKEPYVVNGVWKDIQVMELRITVQDGRITP
jgi:uncharacterized protein